jgi:hypothetical protein
MHALVLSGQAFVRCDLFCIHPETSGSSTPRESEDEGIAIQTSELNTQHSEKRLTRSLSLHSACAILVGSIIGSGTWEIRAFSSHADDFANSHIPSRRVLKDSLLMLKVVLTLSSANAGIFSSPGSVLANTHSIGLAMLAWVVAGLLAILGCATYAELGLSIACQIP